MNILEVVGQDVRLKKRASTDGGEWAGPCPWCGGTDRFRVWPYHSSGKAKWACLGAESNRAGCGENGDLIDFLRKREGMSFKEAQEAAGQPLTGGRKPAQPAPGQAQPPPESWQKLALDVVGAAHFNLLELTPASERAWAYLADVRGLDAETIGVFQVGYNETAGVVGDLWVPAGIVLPWVAAGSLWKVNVRTNSQTDRYREIARPSGGGGLFGAGLFGADHLQGHRDLVIVEGEFDCMVLWQEVKGFADVVTAGNATAKLADRWRFALSQAARVWVAMDNDQAGHQAAEYWCKVMGSKARRLLPPMLDGAKDIGEAYAKGVDLASWLSAAINGVLLRSLEKRYRPGMSDTFAECIEIASLATKVGAPFRGVDGSWPAWLVGVAAEFCKVDLGLDDAERLIA